MIGYEKRAQGYVRHRRTDPRIAAVILEALGGAETLVNVGAGAGSYEPEGRDVLAVEPAAAMRAERPRHLRPAIDARAEELPLDDDAVDAALAVLTVHHWDDPVAGLKELRRVALGPVVILTFDPLVKRGFWLLNDYLPETAERDRQIFPPPSEITETLGSGRIDPVPIPADCRDGFLEAFFARPEAYLDSSVRLAQSGWVHLPNGVEERVVSALSADLKSGAWDQRHGKMRKLTSYDGGLRLIVSPGALSSSSRHETAAAKFVARFAAAWRNPDPPAFRDFWHSEASLLHPTMEQSMPADQIPDHIQTLMNAVPDISLRVIDWAARENTLFIEWELSGTLSGRALRVPGADRFTLRGERAEQGVAYYDTTAWR